MGPDYLSLDPVGQQAYLFQQTDDQLLLLQADQIVLETENTALTDELQRRGLPPAPPAGHLLPLGLFTRDHRERRLPRPAEHVLRTGLFVLTKWSLLLGAPLGMAMEAKAPTPIIAALVALLVLGVAGPLAHAWFTPFYRPLRYTLVRPFNSKTWAKPLKRYLLKNIGLRAQGVTLSDTQFRPNTPISLFHRARWLLFATMAAIGQSASGLMLFVTVAGTWVRQSVRLDTVILPSTAPLLGIDFAHRRRLAAKHFFSGGQCFNIRTNDASWQYAMQAVAYEADFVLVDLTNIREGSAWELDMLDALGRLQNCIAICQEGHEEELERHAHLFSEVIRYDRKGRAIEGKSILQRIPTAVAARHCAPSVSRVGAIATAGDEQTRRATSNAKQGGAKNPPHAHEPNIELAEDLPFPMNWKTALTVLAMGFVTLLVESFGASWSMFGMGLTILTMDLAYRLASLRRYRLIHPRAGPQVLYLPLWPLAALFTLIGVTEVISARHEALENDLQAVRSATIAGTAGQAKRLLSELTGKQTGFAPRIDWRVRIHTSPDGTLVLMQPKSRPLAGAAVGQLIAWLQQRTWLPQEALYAIVEHTDRDRCRASLTPEKGIRTAKAKVTDVLPFYVSITGPASTLRTGTAVVALVLAAGIVVVAYRRRPKQRTI
ncbi:MAG: hypothetical protein AB8H80_02450 [Planctomycetota bacterium]